MAGIRDYVEPSDYVIIVHPFFTMPIMMSPTSKAITITSLAIFTISLVGSLYSIGYKFHFHFPITLRRPEDKDPSSRPLCHYNPPRFDDCKRLQETIHAVKAHVLTSASTRNIYVLICRIFNRQLVGTSLAIDEPSDSTIIETISSSWPTFIPLVERYMSNPSTVVWAYVDKSSSVPEVQLNPDLVSALESAPEGSDLYDILLTILLIALFHELSHHLTKVLFNCKVSPAGCGPERAGSIDGESGDLVEDLLIGGNILVLWKDGKAGEMDKTEGLVLEYRGRFRKLTTDHCRAFLTLIQSPTIRGFPFAQMKVYREWWGITCFRIISSSSDQVETLPEWPKGRGPCRGLGFPDLDSYNVMT